MIAPQSPAESYTPSACTWQDMKEGSLPSGAQGILTSESHMPNPLNPGIAQRANHGHGVDGMGAMHGPGCVAGLATCNMPASQLLCCFAAALPNAFTH